MCVCVCVCVRAHARMHVCWQDSEMEDGGELGGECKQARPFGHSPKVTSNGDNWNRSYGNWLKNSFTNLAFKGKGGPVSNPMNNIYYRPVYCMRVQWTILVTLCKGYTRKSLLLLLYGSKYVNAYLAILALQEKSV